MPNLYADLMVATRDDSVKKQWQDGLRLIREETARSSLAEALRKAAANEGDPQTVLEQFFTLLKQMTVNGYYTALKARDYNAAWNYMSASRNDPASQASTTSTWKSTDDSLGVVTSAQITSTNQDSSGRVTVTVAIHRGAPSNSSSNYTLTLSQYGGSAWLIDNVTAT